LKSRLQVNAAFCARKTDNCKVLDAGVRGLLSFSRQGWERAGEVDRNEPIALALVWQTGSALPRRAPLAFSQGTRHHGRGACSSRLDPLSPAAQN
jgi:hypothetical protein